MARIETTAAMASNSGETLLRVGQPSSKSTGRMAAPPEDAEPLSGKGVEGQVGATDPEEDHGRLLEPDCQIGEFAPLQKIDNPDPRGIPFGHADHPHIELRQIKDQQQRQRGKPPPLQRQKGPDHRRQRPQAAPEEGIAHGRTGGHHDLAKLGGLAAVPPGFQRIFLNPRRRAQQARSEKGVGIEIFNVPFQRPRQGRAAIEPPQKRGQNIRDAEPLHPLEVPARLQEKGAKEQLAAQYVRRAEHRLHRSHPRSKNVTTKPRPKSQ